MRWLAWILCATTLPLTGCHLAERAVHNLVNEPIQYLDEQHLAKSLRREAREVLDLQYDHIGTHVLSPDFIDGFIDGYEDYLEHGGIAAPRAVPPLRYRRSQNLNPEGHARVHDYYTGFQKGADAACETGKRKFLTIPILLPQADQLPPIQVKQYSAEECAEAEQQAKSPIKLSDLPTQQKQPVTPSVPAELNPGLNAPDRPATPLPTLPGIPPKTELPDLPKSSPQTGMTLPEIPEVKPPNPATPERGPGLAPLFTKPPNLGNSSSQVEIEPPSKVSTLAPVTLSQGDVIKPLPINENLVVKPLPIQSGK